MASSSSSSSSSAAASSSAPPPSAVGVSLNAVIGMRVGAPGALAYVDEADLQYVAGRTLVRYDLETRQMRTSPGAAEAVSGITAVATTPNRRTTAYAELGADGAPIVSLFEWNAKAAAGGRRKKVRTERRTAPKAHVRARPQRGRRCSASRREGCARARAHAHARARDRKRASARPFARV
jgi:hypothetical protein